MSCFQAFIDFYCLLFVSAFQFQLRQPLHLPAGIEIAPHLGVEHCTPMILDMTIGSLHSWVARCIFHILIIHLVPPFFGSGLALYNLVGIYSHLLQIIVFSLQFRGKHHLFHCYYTFYYGVFLFPPLQYIHRISTIHCNVHFPILLPASFPSSLVITLADLPGYPQSSRNENHLGPPS